MKKTLIALIVCACMLPFTASGNDMKVGYVDFNKALNESDRGKTATLTLEKMIADKKSLLVAEETRIKELENEVKKQASVLSPDALAEKEAALKKLVRDTQRMRSDFQEELKRKEASLTKEIQKEIFDAVNKIAREDGYTIIFERGSGGILYFENSYDLTDKVIAEYNQDSSAKK